MGKREIARNEQFLPFPTVFSTHLETFLAFSANLNSSSVNLLSLEESKICCLGKGEVIIFFFFKKRERKHYR